MTVAERLSAAREGQRAFAAAAARKERIAEALFAEAGRMTETTSVEEVEVWLRKIIHTDVSVTTRYDALKIAGKRAGIAADDLEAIAQQIARERAAG
jgi:hypothetical protein